MSRIPEAVNKIDYFNNSKFLIESDDRILRPFMEIYNKSLNFYNFNKSDKHYNFFDNKDNIPVVLNRSSTFQNMAYNRADMLSKPPIGLLDAINN